MEATVVGVWESNKNDVISISYCVIAFLYRTKNKCRTLLPARVGGAAGYETTQKSV